MWHINSIIKNYKYYKYRDSKIEINVLNDKWYKIIWLRTLCNRIILLSHNIVLDKKQTPLRYD